MSWPASYSRYLIAQCEAGPSQWRRSSPPWPSRSSPRVISAVAELQVVAPRRLRVERVRQCRDDVRLGRRSSSSPPRRSLRPSTARSARAPGGSWRPPARPGRRRPPRGRRDWAATACPDRWRGRPAGCAGSGWPSPSSESSRSGQPPEVVVAVERSLLVPRPDADLQVEHLLLRVPCLAQPVEAEARLGHQRARRGVAHRARGREHQHDRVRRRVRELDEVAGVEPAALEVDPARSRSSEEPTMTSLSWLSYVGHA